LHGVGSLNALKAICDQTQTLRQKPRALQTRRQTQQGALADFDTLTAFDMPAGLDRAASERAGSAEIAEISVSVANTIHNFRMGRSFSEEADLQRRTGLINRNHDHRLTAAIF
jgi:hypothetical protein